MISLSIELSIAFLLTFILAVKSVYQLIEMVYCSAGIPVLSLRASLLLSFDSSMGLSFS